MSDMNENIRTGTNESDIRRMYDLPQPAFPVALREYLLTSLDETRCCLLQWILQEDIAVDLMRYDLIQINEGGEEIETVEVVLRKEELPEMTVGTLFAPQWATPVSPRCVAIRVIMHEISSGNYLYRVSGDGVQVEYSASTAWVYDKKAGKKDKLKRKATFRADSKLGKRVRGIWPIAFLSMVVVGVVVSVPYLKRVINWELIGRAIAKFISDIRFPWEDDEALETVGTALLRIFRHVS